jgi:putative membrane protein
MKAFSLSQKKFLLILVAVLLIWSGIRPHDYPTWILEVFPAILGIALLLATDRRFEFTRLVYWLMAAHAIVLIIGGHYTYAEVPAFNWLRDTLGLDRNYYDRLGHFMQGFVPAIIAREILIRRSPVKSGKWLYFVVVCICLSISAAYELLEWAVAVTSGSAADAFLATQGDVWDTQWDMFTALCAANVALVLLPSIHDKQLVRLPTFDGLSKVGR